jgi:two-component system, NtrC family, sensor histidine kinase HydH
MLAHISPFIGYRMRVTVRKTLLRAFLLIGLAPAILLTALAFIKARQAMQNEIEHGLVAQADAVASNVNKIMFERLQNAATWSTLEVMQDLQVQDVDKRLSNFLAKLKTGYGGVYRELAALNRDGLVVSSSNPAALGRPLAPHSVWLTTRLAGATLTLDRPVRSDGDATLTIRTPINSQFGGTTIGELILEFDWGQIDSFLDNAAAGGRMVALADTNGGVLAASRSLREAGLLSGQALAGWQLPARSGGAFGHTGFPVWDSAVVVGLGRTSDFAGFAGIGLSTLVIQPQKEALAPVQQMAEILLAILGGLVLITLGVASRISGAIARPIVALTAFTRRYKHGQSPLVALPAATGEVGELGEAFTQMMHDIDQSQRKLVQASKLAVVGEMSSVIAHEVRTPLGILRSAAQMLRREPGLSDEGRELMGFIESETERLNRLVSAMLDSARPRALSKVLTDLHALIGQTSALLRAQIEKGQITVTERLDAADPMVECDADQITQVLLNLILNAVQILPAGGQIRLTTYEDMDQFFIAICDDGPGIPIEERASVFEAFFSRREGGVGLGLAIVQHIVVAHGGDIEADDSELGGARFTIRLPRRTSSETRI